MRTSDLIRLLSLAAIWSGSFIFIKVLAPVLGPVVTACLRVLIAGVVLSVYFYAIKFDVEWKKYWKHYFIIGVVNSSIPFLLYAVAALYIPASLSVILNSSTPLFSAIFAAIWLRDKLTPRKIVGLVLGMAGVSFVALKEAISISKFGMYAALACLGAAICYGLAGIYIKKFSPFLKPLAIAGASQLAAGLALVPFMFLNPIKGTVDFSIVLNMLALALLCSGVAYILYYRLIEDIGPVKAATVPMIMPAFGLLWGVIFLKETITLQMMIGCLFIMAGLILVLFKKNSAT
ncbi:hypothetical protein CIK05_01220 [Bdellovibrio sp. qaytius]|nr:hypothetical protein CIK05_01220 [Bdellovibrio sp. qaytius]